MSDDRVEALVSKLADDLRSNIGEGRMGTLCMMPFEGTVDIIRTAIRAGIELAAAQVNLKQCADDCMVNGYACNRCEVLQDAETAIRAILKEKP